MMIKRFLAWMMVLGWSALFFAQADSNVQPQHLRVSSGVAVGLKTHDVPPAYPREARQKGIQGDVVLHATIDTKGKIINLRVAQGDPILANAAIKAVKHWRYRPYVLNGKLVVVDTTIKIQFHL